MVASAIPPDLFTLIPTARDAGLTPLLVDHRGVAFWASLDRIVPVAIAVGHTTLRSEGQLHPVFVGVSGRGFMGYLGMHGNVPVQG